MASLTRAGGSGTPDQRGASRRAANAVHSSVDGRSGAPVARGRLAVIQGGQDAYSVSARSRGADKGSLPLLGIIEGSGHQLTLLAAQNGRAPSRKPLILKKNPPWAWERESPSKRTRDDLTLPSRPCPRPLSNALRPVFEFSTGCRKCRIHSCRSAHLRFGRFLNFSPDGLNVLPRPANVRVRDSFGALPLLELARPLRWRRLAGGETVRLGWAGVSALEHYKLSASGR